jgi:Fur family transcriptional regulator, ferric uptake regulator
MAAYMVPSGKVVAKSSTPSANLTRALRSAGLRATVPRLAVLEELVAALGSMTHAEVARKLAGTLDRATVYRNLVDLTSAGLLRRSDVGDHVWRFEWIGGTSHAERAHPHFICGSCGTVTCLPEDAVSVKARPGAPRALKRRAAVMVQLRGTCDACS